MVKRPSPDGGDSRLQLKYLDNGSGVYRWKPTGGPKMNLSPLLDHIILYLKNFLRFFTVYVLLLLQSSLFFLKNK